MKTINRFFGFCTLFMCSALQYPIFANVYDFAIVGDGGVVNPDSQSIHNSLLRNKVNHLVMPGDNIYADPIFYPSYESIWGTWFADGFKFDVVAIGNHHRSYEEEINYFNMPAESYSISYDKFATFIVLNSDNDDSAQTQAQFLDAVLNAKRTAPFVFLVYHHPTYTLSIYHPASEKEEFQTAIRPIIEKHRSQITALIVGHEHVSLIAHFNDLPVILNGSTHEQRFHVPLNYQEGSMSVTTNWFNDANALWTHLTLNTQNNSAQVDFVRGTDNAILCEAFITTGSPASLMRNCFQ